MTHPDPEKRPSSTSIFENAFLCPNVNKSKAQLLLELNMERSKNEKLQKKLRDSKKIIQSYEMSQTPGEFNAAKGGRLCSLKQGSKCILVNNKKPRIMHQNDTIMSDRTLRSTARRTRRCLK